MTDEKIIGDADKTNSDDVAGSTDIQDKKDFVDYSTYDRVLKRHKKDREELNQLRQFKEELELKQKDLEQQRMIEEGKVKEVLAQREKELEDERKKAQYFAEEFVNTNKLNAFKERLPGRLADSSYENFIAKEKILINEETGDIDEESLNATVNDFMEKHHRLLDIPKKKNLPFDAAGSASRLSVSEWQKLPFAERKKRMGEVYSQNNK